MRLEFNSSIKIFIGLYCNFYSLNNKEIFFSVLPEDVNIIAAIYTSLFRIMKPALETSKNYGTITEADKKNFLFGTDSYIKFLRSTKDDLESTINFEVNHVLFKGFLLAPHQIKATSMMKDKVAEVEKGFLIWIHQMQEAATQGKLILYFYARLKCNFFLCNFRLPNPSRSSRCWPCK